MTFTIQVGDIVRIKPKLYIEDYDYNSHHFKCSVDDVQVSEKYTNIFIPANSSIFGYRDPPEIYYKVPDNFEYNLRSIQGKKGYIFKPKLHSDFEKTGKVFYDCLDYHDQSFSRVEGVRHVRNEEVLKLVGHTLSEYRIEGVVDRIYRIKLGPIDKKGRKEDLLLYVNSVSVNEKYNSVVMAMINYICVIIVDDYEVYIPTFFVRKLK